MSIFDNIEKLINEHGSAAILRDRVELFKDQLSILKEKFQILETENINLKTKNQDLETDNARLKKKIQSLEKPTRNNLLDENKVNILKFLWSQHDRLTAEEISSSLKIDLQIIKFHLEELEKLKMVHAALTIGFPASWLLIQEGRKYLIENKMIS